MRIAIVADWLVTFGGAEHVLSSLHAMFPDAPIFTTVKRAGALGPLNDANIRTTSLQKLYAITKNHQILLPLLPRAIESIDLTGFDVIISSSHAVGKGIIPPPGALHICYCHTPIRYAWEMEDQYLDDFHVPKMLRTTIKKQLNKIRRWDMTSAKRVDVFIANSTTTQERIKRIYGRESVVIAPPVDEKFFHHSLFLARRSLGEAGSILPVRPHPGGHSPSSYFLAIGRLVPYKRFDLLIDVANTLQLPLKIAGRGQDEARLKKRAGPTVEFLGFVPEDDLPSLYANADALLFPQYEDAGIVALEAQACGTPVIAYKAGGATDAVEDGITGLFFEKQTAASVIDALERFKNVTWNRTKILERSRQFSQGEFRRRFEEELKRVYSGDRGQRFRRSKQG